MFFVEQFKLFNISHKNRYLNNLLKISQNI